jgi:hypothetical protein
VDESVKKEDEFLKKRAKYSGYWKKRFESGRKIFFCGKLMGKKRNPFPDFRINIGR